MNAIRNFADRLVNVMSGQGTSIDRRSATSYVFDLMTPDQAEAAYRTSWLVRKIIDIPPLDMTRAWREWQAQGSEIEDIEKEERRLQLRMKCKRALTLARLYGGGMLYLGTGERNPEKPLNPDSIKQGGLKFIHVLSPQQVSLGPQILDPESEWHDRPSFYEIRTGAGVSAAMQWRLKIHPSRIVDFIGQRAPEGSLYQNLSQHWGDPLMQSIGEAVRNADTTTAGFAALIDEAKLDVLKMPGLTDIAQTTEGAQRISNRLAATQLGKSTWRALLLDAEDDWEQRQVTWAGIPDIISSYLSTVAGAADIPITRLLGQSPSGLASTGDGERADYQDMVKARQDELLAPALDFIDPLLIRSALGSYPDTIYYEFGALSAITEKEAGTIEAQAATTLKTYADTGLIPEAALADMAKNRIIESGRWPGSQGAFDDAEAAGALAPNLDPQLKAEKAAAAMALAHGPAAVAGVKAAANENQAKAIVQTGKASGKFGAKQADALMLLVDDLSDAGHWSDMRPRSLYISRKLLNADELIAWARGQGFENVEAADELHVTQLYSRTPLDWLKLDDSWGGGDLTVPAGGARIVEPLGDKGAVTLLFTSSQLSWRHEELVRSGASHDFNDYSPHVTISYDAAGLDLDAVEPYRGELRFGPEIFREINDDWRASVGDVFNPNQPRAHGAGSGGGHWTGGAGSAGAPVTIKLSLKKPMATTKDWHEAADEAHFGENPLNPQERLAFDGDTIGGVSIRNFDGGWHLSDLRSITRGGGRVALTQVVELADKYQQAISLAAVPGESPAGKKLSKAKLRKFYEGFGFKPDSGDYMNRAPRTSSSDRDNHWELQPRGHGAGSGGGRWIKEGTQIAHNEIEARVIPLTPEAKYRMLDANRGKEIDRLVEEATHNQEVLRRIGTDLEDQGLEFHEPPKGSEVKKRDSIERKVRDELYSGPHMLSDISRASIVVKDYAQAERAVQVLGQRGTIYDKGWTELGSTGYYDRKIYLAHPNGGVSEVQLVPTTVYQAKNEGGGHTLYEKSRLAGTPKAEVDALTAQQRELYGKARRGTPFENPPPAKG